MTRITDLSPLGRVMRRVDAVADGGPPTDTIPTGFPSLDRTLGGGLRRGDLVVIGGDIGVGKSALALAIALRAAQHGHAATFFTGEANAERVIERALSLEGRAPIDDIRGGKLEETTRAALGAAAVRLRDRMPDVFLLPSAGISELALELRSIADPALVVIDPLQALASGGHLQDEQHAHAVRELKRAAVELNIAIVLTAHTPHLQPTRANPRPTLADFGALGAPQQHADVILGLFREELYPALQGAEGATELGILKNRNGPSGMYVDLYFYKQWLRFEDMAE
ncbi:MAG: DnaB helicase C-terminal domain-containing protein [Gemmatimonadota bacterium]|nr:DnaB helicase C-terminal domain-containing protein [Gemmatimonadota bacterium]